VGRSGAENRWFVEAVRWIARTGSTWRDLPGEFGHGNSTYVRLARGSRAGVWQAVFAALARDADLREAMIDSTIVRAHRHAAGARKRTGAQALGRSRGGLTSKIQVIADSAWPCGARPPDRRAAQRRDAQALPRLAGVDPGALIEGKAYASVRP